MDAKKRIDWVKKIIGKSGANGVVLGLSGGKDSAVVCALCAKANIKVLGTYLPIGNNSTTDIEYIEPLLKAFPQVEFHNYAPEILKEVFEKIRDASYNHNPISEKSGEMSIANIKPRIRMTMLYAIAQSRNYLVAGTGNACESYVGYFTKWGDGAHDFNPIADLTVDEVIELGRDLGVPEKCLVRVPSAGLWDGQTDEGELGVKYSDIAKIIKFGEKAIEHGVSESDYQKIESMHTRSLHKLNPIPTFEEPKMYY